jgi:hypothetical protein
LDVTGDAEPSGVDASVGTSLDAAADVTLAHDAASGVDAARVDSSVAKDASIDGALPSDASDGAVMDAQNDSSPSDASDSSVVDAADAGCMPVGTIDCFVLPSGWNVVAYAQDGSAQCPTGFMTNAATFEEGPTASASACTCSGCAITTQPTCLAGQVGIHYDVGVGGCNLSYNALQNPGTPGGACGTDNYHSMILGIWHTEFDPPPPSGAACDAPSASHKDQITFASTDRVCSADSLTAAGCNATTCSPSVPSPFAACIAQAGDVACPAGPFGVKHLVGSDVVFDCAPCGCSVSATCSGTVTYFTDGACTMGAMTMQADGQCHGIPNGGTFGSYEYAASPSGVTCNQGPAPAASNLSLTGTETICCAQ